ncbi:MAG: TPM domain-containing protein [Thermodesulfobacteriota bacterium]|nr:TPM domain-containing protein [Thermodesulfobacteriota bacterium]
MDYECRFYKKAVFGFLSRALLALFILLFFSGMVCAAATPLTYVDDRAGIIDARARHALSGYLQELEQKTGTQMIILTVPSTNGVPIDEYSISLAEKWGLGQKGRDNGLLMVIASKDRKYRIETGYGLEGILPDSRLGGITRQYLVPAFKKGDYTAGIYNTAVVIMGIIAKDSNVKLTGLPHVASRARERSSSSGSLLGLIIFIMLISSLFSRRTRGLLPMLFLGSMLGGGYSGGRSSGGFGSFGGGLGGSFGGGGVSGGW